MLFIVSVNGNSYNGKSGAYEQFDVDNPGIQYAERLSYLEANKIGRAE